VRVRAWPGRDLLSVAGSKEPWSSMRALASPSRSSYAVSVCNTHSCNISVMRCVWRLGPGQPGWTKFAIAAAAARRPIQNQNACGGQCCGQCCSRLPPPCLLRASTRPETTPSRPPPSSRTHLRQQGMRWGSRRAARRRRGPGAWLVVCRCWVMRAREVYRPTPAGTPSHPAPCPELACALLLGQGPLLPGGKVAGTNARGRCRHAPVCTPLFARHLLAPLPRQV